MSHRPSFHLLYPAGWSRAAENVAAGFAASAVVNAWANSAGHRANLLSNNTDIGIGVAANANGRLYFTQNFGRFSMSAQISARTFPSSASTVYIASGFDFPDALSAAALDAYGSTGAPVVYIATGTGFADALAAGPAAASVNAPVILVYGSASSADSETLAVLTAFSTQRVVIVGGEGAVSAGIEQSLITAGFEVSRFSGADRYATASLIAAHHFPHAARSYLATGMGFADALSGGAAAGSLGAPLFTVLSSCVPPAAHAAMSTQNPDDLVLLGGLGALSPTVAGFYRC